MKFGNLHRRALSQVFFGTIQISKYFSATFFSCVKQQIIFTRICNGSVLPPEDGKEGSIYEDNSDPVRQAV